MTQHSSPPTLLKKFCTAARSGLTVEEKYMEHYLLLKPQKPSKVLRWKACTLQALQVPHDIKRK